MSRYPRPLHSLIARDEQLRQRIRPFLFAPFDVRYAYYRREMLMTASHRVGRHLLDATNVALMAMRQVSIGSGFTHAFVTRELPNNRAFYSTKGKVALFPLTLVPDSHALQVYGGSTGVNLDPVAWARLSHWSADDQSRESAEAVFGYCYAVLSSPTYRRRYDPFLRSDYPRIPVSASIGMGETLTKLGREMMSLHLLESPMFNDVAITYDGPPGAEVSHVGWSDDIVWLDAAMAKKGQPASPGTIGFQGVPEDVWNFHIGGYQVCEKWLKDRKGRTLSEDDIAHYQKIVVAIAETIRIMGEIDEVIEDYGGWPGAFVSSSS